jgi:hypothetical protein
MTTIPAEILKQIEEAAVKYTHCPNHEKVVCSLCGTDATWTYSLDDFTEGAKQFYLAGRKDAFEQMAKSMPEVFKYIEEQAQVKQPYSHIAGDVK